jgi:hypothetical protein
MVPDFRGRLGPRPDPGDLADPSSFSSFDIISPEKRPGNKPGLC